MSHIYMAKNALAGASAIAMQDASGVAVVAAAGGFDLANLIDGFPGTVFRPAIPTSGRIVFTVPLTTKTSCIALINHRIPSGATVLWQTSSDGENWITRADLSSRFASRSCYATYEPVIGRFCSLAVTVPGGNADTWQIGELWAGEHVSLSRGMDGGARQGQEHRSITVETEAGVSIGYHLASHRSMSGEFSAVDAAERAEVEALIDAMRGNVNPLLWVPDASKSDCYIAKCRVTGYSPRDLAPDKWDGISLDVFEIPAGREGN